MDCRTNCFSLVIEEFDEKNNKHISFKDIENYLESEDVIKFYALILHDKDEKEENGKVELVRKHYHLVIYLNNAYSRNTVINSFADKLECNKYCISARVGDLIESTLYLTHSDSKNSKKHVYSSLDIHTNDITNLNSILSRQVTSYCLTIEYLTELVIKHNSLSEIYTILGLKDSKLYRNIIRDLYEDIHYRRKGRL